MENEIWKDIPGYEGIYKISNYGNIYSEYVKRTLKTKKDKKSGYSKTTLVKNGINKNHFIHRLVAQTFIPNPENKPLVCHKIPVLYGGTNSVDNLYWGTLEDNVKDRVKDGNHSKVIKELMGKAVLQIDPETGKIIQKFDSIREANNAMTGSPLGGVGAVCNGERNIAYGYFWKFDDGKPIIIKESKNKPKAVYQIDKNTKNIINEYSSVSDAARAINGDSGHICKVCSGKAKSHKGYIWKYKD